LCLIARQIPQLIEKLPALFLKSLSKFYKPIIFLIPESVQNRNLFEKCFLRKIVILSLGGILWLAFPLTFLNSSLKL